MGMGHRIYRQRDPRAVTELELAPRAHAPAADGGVRARLTFAREVERAAESLLAERYPERKLKTNVEFYTAVLLSALAIDSTLFSPLFACARGTGWAAHFAEQQRNGSRLIRPASLYTCPMPLMAASG
jgi:citrate synthase